MTNAVKEILANCAYRYCHPESCSWGTPQQVIDKQIENGVNVLRRLNAEPPLEHFFAGRFKGDWTKEHESYLLSLVAGKQHRDNCERCKRDAEPGKPRMNSEKWFEDYCYDKTINFAARIEVGSSTERLDELVPKLLDAFLAQFFPAERQEGWDESRISKLVDAVWKADTPQGNFSDSTHADYCVRAVIEQIVLALPAPPSAPENEEDQRGPQQTVQLSPEMRKKMGLKPIKLAEPEGEDGKK